MFLNHSVLWTSSQGCMSQSQSILKLGWLNYSSPNISWVGWFGNVREVKAATRGQSNRHESVHPGPRVPEYHKVPEVPRGPYFKTGWITPLNKHSCPPATVGQEHGSVRIPKKFCQGKRSTGLFWGALLVDRRRKERIPAGPQLF